MRLCFFGGEGGALMQIVKQITFKICFQLVRPQFKRKEKVLYCLFLFCKETVKESQEVEEELEFVI